MQGKATKEAGRDKRCPFAELLERLGLLLVGVAGAEPALARAMAERTAAFLRELQSELEGLERAYDGLPLEEKAREEIAGANWNASRDGDGEYAFADELPNLRRLLERRGRKARLGDYVYYLSRSGRTITRYPRSRGAVVEP